MARIAARDPRRAAELPRAIAQILFSACAGGTVAAADPRKNGVARANDDVTCRRTCGHDFAFDFMAQSVRQRQMGERQAVAAAEFEIAVMNVHVAVADAGVMNLQQNLRALREGCGRLDLLKWSTECNDRLRQH